MDPNEHMLKLTSTGSDLRNTLNEDLSGSMWAVILPDLSTMNTTSGFGHSPGNVNLGTRVSMRAFEFGRVGCVSRRALGEEREVHLMRRMKSVERVVDVWPRVASACVGLKVVVSDGVVFGVCPPRWTEIGWEGDYGGGGLRYCRNHSAGCYIPGRK